MSARPLLGVALVLLAGAVAPDHGDDRAPASREPLALALAPLGPVEAIASAALWVAFERGQALGDTARVTALAEALLALHPDLEPVRVHLASELILTEARRAADRERHEALLARGLAMLDDGLALRDSPVLHGALGRLLWLRQDTDPYFTRVVERELGDLPDALAIEHLAKSELAPRDRLLLATLLVRRGIDALFGHDDREAAAADLARADEVLEPLRSDDPAVDDLVEPLRQALAPADEETEDRRSP